MLVPLNVKSAYSLLESSITIDELIDYASGHDWSSVAVMDHEALHASLKFLRAAKKADIQPLLGLSLESANHQAFEKAFHSSPTEELGHQLVNQAFDELNSKADQDKKEGERQVWKCLAKNNQGYLDMVQLLNQFHQEGLSKNFLQASSDLIWIWSLPESSCKSMDDIESYLKWAENNDQFYLGIDVGFAQANPQFAEHDRLVVLDEFTHVKAEDWAVPRLLEAIHDNQPVDMKELQDRSMAESTGVSLEELPDLESAYRQLGFNQAVENTEKIAASCQVEGPSEENRYPSFKQEAGTSSTSLLREKAEKGLKARACDESSYRQRLDKELDVIDRKGFSDYFLIVGDIMDFARKSGIQTGPGRGSAAGSLVAYLLGIIEVDPVHYGLIFERFLNPERQSPPDIDLDFPDNKRQQVIQYIQDRYGRDHVAQIMTFGTFGAKQAVRDVGRMLKLNSDQLSVWSKAIPSSPGISLKQARKESKAFNRLIEESDFNRRMFEWACKIEGLPRNTSIHASGIIVSDQALTEFIPVLETEGILISQYDMHDLEELGLLKLDILGLKNLRILDDAVYGIRKQDESAFDLSLIDLQDKKTYQLFQEGDTNGVFQFESRGMKAVLKRLKPSDFEDIVAVIALYRPGPMSEIDHYIKRKHGEEAVTYPHFSLKDILEPTYGILIYQEQIMQIAQHFAGYSMGEADLFRRAISKKDQKLMDQEKEKFIQGSLKKGHSKEEALSIYQVIERFADYGFNRSHAVAYSLLSYQMAYIKAHYPTAFYTALLRSASPNKKERYEQEIYKKGIKVSGPSINRSYYSYIYDHSIRLGLSSIQGLKRRLTQDILEERKQAGSYQDFIDFTRRLSVKDMSEESLTHLIQAGAFDEFDQSRGTLLASLSSILTNVESGQYTQTLGELFKPHYVEAADLPQLDKLEQEYLETGYVYSQHPIEKVDDLRRFLNIPLLRSLEADNRSYRILVTLHDIHRIQTKKGENMAFLRVSDASDFLDVTLFPKEYRRYIQEIEVGTSYVMEGKLEKRRNEKQLLLSKLQAAEDLRDNLDLRRLFLRLEEEDAQLYQSVIEIICDHPGQVPVYIYVEDSKQTFKLKKDLHVAVNSELLEKLMRLLGEEHVVVTSV